MPSEDTLTIGAPTVPSFEVLLKVYKLACKYGVPNLKEEATERYCAVLAEEWPRGYGTLLAKGLMAVFEEGVKEGEKLRDAALDVVVRYGEELLSDREIFGLLGGEALRALLLRMGRKVNEAGGKPASSAPEKPMGEKASLAIASARS